MRMYACSPILLRFNITKMCVQISKSFFEKKTKLIEYLKNLDDCFSQYCDDVSVYAFFFHLMNKWKEDEGYHRVVARDFDSSYMYTRTHTTINEKKRRKKASFSSLFLFFFTYIYQSWHAKNAKVYCLFTSVCFIPLRLNIKTRRIDGE